jgi:hypothetical protein
MAMRTSKRTVTFIRPFTLGGSGVEFPAGRYFVETDEERVDELSFPFYRRTATLMQLIADPLRPGITETGGHRSPGARGSVGSGRDDGCGP